MNILIRRVLILKIYIKENVIYIVFIVSNFFLFYKIDWKDKYICKYMWWLLLYIEYLYNVFMYFLNIFYEFIRI